MKYEALDNSILTQKEIDFLNELGIDFDTLELYYDCYDNTTFIRLYNEKGLKAVYDNYFGIGNVSPSLFRMLKFNNHYTLKELGIYEKIDDLH